MRLGGNRSWVPLIITMLDKSKRPAHVKPPPYETTYFFKTNRPWMNDPIPGFELTEGADFCRKYAVSKLFGPVWTGRQSLYITALTGRRLMRSGLD